MLRKASILTLALGGVCCFGVSNASAQFLPGNVWPNPDLSVAATPGIDQVFSYYNGGAVGSGNPSLANGGTYQPYTSGDTNPRPAGWHRGGNFDFGTTTTPSYDFYNTPGAGAGPPPGLGGSAGEGNAPQPPIPSVPPVPPGGGYALEVTDSSTSFYGEWFSDWNALPVTAGKAFDLRFFYENTNVHSTQRPENTDQFRVSAYFGDLVGNETLTNTNQIGNSTDFLIPAGSPDVTTWTEVDETLIVPAGAQSMKITVDSGGSSAATGNIWVTDLSVSAVPEPTSIGLLSGGALLLAKRRRRA
jgi:hypothetical protein